MTAPRPRWALCRARDDSAALRMYCFPHSGGSPGEYMRWSDRLPGTEVWGVQLPGRGSRLAESPFTDMPELVDAVVSGLGFTGPYVLFGHSLGALVAFETAHALRERGLPGPRALLLSGSAAPHVLRPFPSLSDLEGEELVAAVEKVYGPVPPEIHQDAELRDMLLDGLRADLRVVGQYTHRGRPALDVPITVFAGSGDDETPAELAAWQACTTAACEVRMFQGDHFYFRESPDAFFTALTASLTAARAESAPRDLPGTDPLAAAPAVP
ncbi:alpha/beta fold hydrolase [Streptomyces sp. NBC_00435]|uniref:thioesterase II family protein n=1 Tax=Streptomyces sp. NBC_00435 TaxID=2903649 RepID=UPI002E1CBB26